MFKQCSIILRCKYDQLRSDKFFHVSGLVIQGKVQPSFLEVFSFLCEKDIAKIHVGLYQLIEMGLDFGDLIMWQLLEHILQVEPYVRNIGEGLYRIFISTWPFLF